MLDRIIKLKKIQFGTTDSNTESFDGNHNPHRCPLLDTLTADPRTPRIDRSNHQHLIVPCEHHAFLPRKDGHPNEVTAVCRRRMDDVGVYGDEIPEDTDLSEIRCPINTLLGTIKEGDNTVQVCVSAKNPDS